MPPIQSYYVYCHAVCTYVRFKPDYDAIIEELSGPWTAGTR